MRFVLMLLPMVSVQAQFVYTEPAYFQEYETLLEPSFLKRCVKREFPPTNGDLCRKKPKACLWGEQTCAGEVQPATRCDCKDREWSCTAFACPTIPAQCPVEIPSSIFQQPICRTDLTCNYGEMQTCCGRTFPKNQCSCDAGSAFECVEIDICNDSNISCADILKHVRPIAADISLSELSEAIKLDMQRNGSINLETVPVSDGNSLIDSAVRADGPPALIVDPATPIVDLNPIRMPGSNDDRFVPSNADIELSCPIVAKTGDDCSSSFAVCEFEQQCCPDGSRCAAVTECVCADDDTFECAEVTLNCDADTTEIEGERDDSSGRNPPNSRRPP